MKGKSSPIIIGTRGSELALWQANFTKDTLENKGLLVELKIIKTKGDATQQWNLSFDKLEGKGFFTKELEEALLSEEIDLAVHSCKDLPTENSPGLTIAAYSKRANPFDLLLIRKECVDETRMLKLKDNAVIGTSSARRKAQLLAFRPDIELQDMRGNVPTRVQKLREKEYDAIVLASAGLERLNIDLADFEMLELKAPMFIPAPAQGVLAFQIRENDEALIKVCEILNDKESHAITDIERKVLHDFDGGCQIPLGVFSRTSDAEIHTWVSYADAWNTTPKRTHFVIPANTEPDPSFSESLLKKIKDFRAKEIFISSDTKEEDYLVRTLRSFGCKVESGSFIDFQPIAFSCPADADWLFFSSKNGVKFFFEQAGSAFDPEKTKIAAINNGTAQAIFEYGYKVEFIGEGGDLSDIALKFDRLATGKIVFPQAKTSMQSIQKKLLKNPAPVTLIVYENQPATDIGKRTEEILIFTSPMGVTAYFSKYTLEKFQKIISIGRTTTKKLKDSGVIQVKTAYEPSPWSLIDEVFSLDQQP